MEFGAGNRAVQQQTLPSRRRAHPLKPDRCVARTAPATSHAHTDACAHQGADLHTRTYPRLTHTYIPPQPSDHLPGLSVWDSTVCHSCVGRVNVPSLNPHLRTKITSNNQDPRGNRQLRAVVSPRSGGDQMHTGHQSDHVLGAGVLGPRPWTAMGMLQRRMSSHTHPPTTNTPHTDTVGTITTAGAPESWDGRVPASRPSSERYSESQSQAHHGAFVPSPTCLYSRDPQGGACPGRTVRGLLTLFHLVRQALLSLRHGPNLVQVL